MFVDNSEIIILFTKYYGQSVSLVNSDSFTRNHHSRGRELFIMSRIPESDRIHNLPGDYMSSPGLTSSVRLSSDKIRLLTTFRLSIPISPLIVKIIYHIHPSYSSDIEYPRSSVTYTNSPLSCFVHSSSTSSDLATTPGPSKGIGRKRKRSEAGENYASRTNGEGRARGSEKRNEGKDEGERRASLYLKDVMLRIIETRFVMLKPCSILLC